MYLKIKRDVMWRVDGYLVKSGQCGVVIGDMSHRAWMEKLSAQATQYHR